MRVVMKFGGTSVGSADAIRQVTQIVTAAARQHQVVLVVSAMNNPDLRTTDLLVSAARASAQGEAAAGEAAADRLLAYHLGVAASLLAQREYEALASELGGLLDRTRELARAMAVLGELTPRALDLIAGQGERCNARLVAAALRSAGTAAEAIDATQLIVTDDRFGDASPIMEETSARCRERLPQVLERGTVPVVTGFIGATRGGVPTTLGRGGSDYSAAILGAVLDAEEVWFWKEVEGVLSADPRAVPDAQPLERLSYTEMAELAYYGASVLHPKTVWPLVSQSIPLRVRNTFSPEMAGTLVTSEAVPAAVKAVTTIRDIGFVTVAGPGLLGLTGVAARIFGAVSRSGANVLLITQASSEQNICFAVPLSQAKAAIAEVRRELSMEIAGHDVELLDYQPAVIVAVVGSGMRGTPGIAGRVFGALGQERINVVAIAQGSSEYNISLVVAEGDGDRAARAIHAAFGLGNVRPPIE